MTILTNGQYVAHLSSANHKAEWIADYMKFGGHSLDKAERDFATDTAATISKYS